MNRSGNSSNQNPPLNRRGFNRTLFGLGMAGAATGFAVPRLASAFAPDRRASPNEQSPAELISPEARRAIDKGLEYLSRSQIKNGRKRGAFGNSGYASGVATCSLGGLAFMCGGSAPGEGPYGRNVDMCVEYVLSNTREDGYIALRGNNPNENMYGHGFSMLFLSQAYGMTRRTAIGDKLRTAVELTCRTQNNDGGWRYQPRKSDADLSITVCQIMGLRGARDAGIDVPGDVREKCIDYVKKSQNRNGSFRYTLRGGHTTFAMTAAGVTSLYSANIYEGEEVESALEYLSKFKPGSTGSHFFYSNYYAVQAMWHAGGDYWNQWYPEIRDYLINKQLADGSWQSDHAGNEYGTAMACIIMQMPLNYLPVFSA
ncbi:MAG: prenyltransferase/squalene oxidase repeat-containing protein [Planctomycetota bacterium]